MLQQLLDRYVIAVIQSQNTFPGTGDGQTNESGSGHMSYCWAEIEGYSKFGIYNGNGNADGRFCVLWI